MLYMRLGAIAGIAALLTILFLHSKREGAKIESAARISIPAVGPVSARPQSPPLSFALEDSSQLEAQALRGQVVHLVFWAEWCEPCRREFASLQKVASEKGPGYKIILLNLDDDEEARNRARAFLKEQKISLFAVYRDVRKMADLLKVEALPYHTILDKEGRIAADFIASIDDDLPAFQKLIDGLLRE